MARADELRKDNQRLPLRHCLQERRRSASDSTTLWSVLLQQAVVYTLRLPSPAADRRRSPSKRRRTQAALKGSPSRKYQKPWKALITTNPLQIPTCPIQGLRFPMPPALECKIHLRGGDGGGVQAPVKLGRGAGWKRGSQDRRHVLTQKN